MEIVEAIKTRKIMKTRGITETIKTARL